MSLCLLGAFAFGLDIGRFSLLPWVPCPGVFNTWLWLPVAIMVALVPCLLVPSGCVCWLLPILFLGLDE